MASEWARLRQVANVAAEEAEAAVWELRSGGTGTSTNARFQVKEKLSALSDAVDHMRLAVASGDATDKEVRRRGDIVAGFESRQAALGSIVTEVTGQRAERDELLKESKAARSQAASSRGNDLSSALEIQEQRMRQQTADIEALADTVGNTKNIASTINKEVDEQVRLLDGFQRGFDVLRNDVRRAVEAAAVPLESPYNMRAFCTLLWPLVLLIFVIFWSLLHSF